MRILILGGSGFLSGTVARLALESGHETSVVTRGTRAIAPGLNAIVVDRKEREAFALELGRHPDWDLVVDCIGYDTEDALQDRACFSNRCGNLIFISTDFVYDPFNRVLPQAEEPATYASAGYGGKKRAAECVFFESDTTKLPWTVLRPSHIYGPGSLLGCLPEHGRDRELLQRIENNENLRLVGGGAFLQHPVFAPDLAKTILSALGNKGVAGQIYNVANPDVVPSLRYYEIIAELLGQNLQVEAIPLDEFLGKNPDKSPFCCDRVYDISSLKASGLHVPQTTLESGLRQHVKSLQPAAT